MMPQIDQVLARALSRLAYTVRIKEYTMVRQVTPTQRQVLVVFMEEDRVLTLSEVAHRMGVSAATASDALAVLERKGYLLGGVQPRDLRACALQITPEGLRCVHETEGMLQAGLDRLDPEDKEYLLMLANTLTEALYIEQAHLSKKVARKLMAPGPPLPQPAPPVVVPPPPPLDDVHARLLRARNLRKPIAVLDWLLARCPIEECEECARIVCPHNDPNHFRNCPSCRRMIKGAAITTSQTSSPSL